MCARRTRDELLANRRWLAGQMNPYFFISMRDEPAALAILERELRTLDHNRRLILADREKSPIMALDNQPGTFYDSLRRVHEREISYAMIAHSEVALPGSDRTLEIQRFEFDRKSNREIREGKEVAVPLDIRRRVARE